MCSRRYCQFIMKVQTSVDRMNAHYLVLKRCSLVAPALWAFAAIPVLHLNTHIHAYFAKPVNSKPAVRMSSKAPNNGSHNSVTFCRTVNGNISPSLCLTCFGLLTTGSCSTDSFAAPLVPCSNTLGDLGSKLVSFVPYIPMTANSINIRTFIYW